MHMVLIELRLNRSRPTVQYCTAALISQLGNLCAHKYCGGDKIIQLPNSYLDGSELRPSVVI